MTLNILGAHRLTTKSDLIAMLQIHTNGPKNEIFIVGWWIKIMERVGVADEVKVVLWKPFLSHNKKFLAVEVQASWL